MQRHSDDSLHELKFLSSKLESCGYESVLLVYHSLLPDYMIRVANIIDADHSLKYMFAIRTYAISPEYCAMMCEAFHLIDPKRIILNIAAGDLKPEETSLEDVVRIGGFLKDYSDRVEYTSEWLEKFLNLRYFKNKPELVVSGTSSKTIDNSERYGDIHLAMLSSYKDGLSVNTGRKMAACPVIIRDTHEEAEAVFEAEENRMTKFSMIYGTEDEVIEKIKKLEDIGITDFLLNSDRENEDEKIHKMVKKMLKGN
jgi:alkanesulfonate monooxygenase SsuD/methylene tetrahydromethanopterin reductase-like flavin-dependent oxidoreductase (luciferase family)